MTSRGYLTDLIASIEEDIATSSHLEERLQATEDDSEKKELAQFLKAVLDLRREKMLYLMDKAENPNPLEWCTFKHCVGSAGKMAEVYEATGDEKALELAIKSSNVRAMATSRFLGVEFETCARCLADKMLTEQVKKERSDTIESTNGEYNK